VQHEERERQPALPAAQLRLAARARVLDAQLTAQMDAPWLTH
jgi:hypothetical protein